MSTTITLPRSVQIWRKVQFAVWLVGLAMIYFLIFIPKIGLALVWNILIPIAPALLVVATGVWRNVCPLAFTSLIPNRLGISKKIRLKDETISKLNFIGVILLLVIVPMRHAILNDNGLATAITLLSVGLTVLIFGLFFESKSVWCSGLCPVHPVEKLYGSKVLFTVPNAQCGECFKCVAQCPDSTPGINPLSNKKSNFSKLSGYLIVGGFPGYIWGWFQVRDFTGFDGFNHLISIFAYPFISMIITLLIFSLLRNLFSNKQLLINIFAALAVSCYYWFRIPNLFGFGEFHLDGLLIDLTQYLNINEIMIMKIASTLFFFWWLVIRKKNFNSWAIRPPYAKTN
jgi:hypothetical protein